MRRAAKIWQVSIGNSLQVIQCRADATNLHAEIVAWIDDPFACASGNCGACISRLDAGRVVMLPRGDASLSAEQVKAGQTLACRAWPKGDVAITWLRRGRR